MSKRKPQKSKRARVAGSRGVTGHERRSFTPKKLNPLKTRCPTGKRRYMTRADAERGLAECRSQAPEDERRRERDFYECDWCRGYHLTSSASRNGEADGPHNLMSGS